MPARYIRVAVLLLWPPDQMSSYTGTTSPRTRFSKFFFPIRQTPECQSILIHYFWTASMIRYSVFTIFYFLATGNKVNATVRKLADPIFTQLMTVWPGKRSVDCWEDFWIWFRNLLSLGFSFHNLNGFGCVHNREAVVWFYNWFWIF